MTHRIGPGIRTEPSPELETRDAAFPEEGMLGL